MARPGRWLRAVQAPYVNHLGKEKAYRFQGVAGGFEVGAPLFPFPAALGRLRGLIIWD